MEVKDDIKTCKICHGEYPESKHDFDECYSLDPEWDLIMINKPVVKKSLDHIFRSMQQYKDYYNLIML